MGQKITFYGGSLPHFTDWLTPIYLQLPPESRGGFYAKGRSAERANQLGVDVQVGVPRREPLVCVASYEDYRAVKPASVVLVNHGIGMRYSDAPNHPSYSGGDDRSRVMLHLCPSEHDAEVCRRDGSQAVAVGPIKLTPWHDGSKVQRMGEKPVVAFSFHADIHVTVETRWAFPEYRQSIIDLVRQLDPLPFTIIGHAHPRVEMLLAKFWKRIGVEFVRSFDDVLSRASLFVADNTSCLYEFASTGRPVVCLNASFYRRDVHHNMRFWSHVPGLQVDTPDALLSTILLALEDHWDARQMREEAVTYAYAGTQGQSLCDGLAVKRAVEAICRLT